jgi:DNA oxidative demethylase
MSVAMTNCGSLGWVSDRLGYRYTERDPSSGCPWPSMPSAFFELAQAAARDAGFPRFVPDACLVNRYEPGARLTLHQDRDERDFDAPIVSVSLGLPAVFLFGGDARTDRHRRVTLQHGDAVVWGGPARLHHHGVLALKDGHHEMLGSQRLNLTFRKAGWGEAARRWAVAGSVTGRTYFGLLLSSLGNAPIRMSVKWMATNPSNMIVASIAVIQGGGPSSPYHPPARKDLTHQTIVKTQPANTTYANALLEPGLFRRRMKMHTTAVTGNTSHKRTPITPRTWAIATADSNDISISRLEWTTCGGVFVNDQR